MAIFGKRTSDLRSEIRKKRRMEDELKEARTGKLPEKRGSFSGVGSFLSSMRDERGGSAGRSRKRSGSGGRDFGGDVNSVFGSGIGGGASDVFGGGIGGGKRGRRRVDDNPFGGFDFGGAHPLTGEISGRSSSGGGVRRRRVKRVVRQRRRRIPRSSTSTQPGHPTAGSSPSWSPPTAITR